MTRRLAGPSALHRMLLPLILIAMALPACGKGAHGPGAGSALAPPTDLNIAAMPQLTFGSGMAEGVIGLYWLTPGDAAGKGASLEPIRAAAEQGDLYNLSIRPFLKPGNVRLVEVNPAGNNLTEYVVEFSHPFDMPADLERPATASKRADLFLFDLHLTVVADGIDAFYGGNVITNLSLVENADGYRRIDPLIALADLGIQNATIFPYKLLTLADESNPRGNYSPSDAWGASTLLTATGYDVVPQGATVRTTILGNSSLPPGVAVVFTAKYMDPRDGANVDELRANRLPDPGDASALRYYCPEACGDIQQTAVSVSGSLPEDSSTASVNLDLAILDWDNSAPVVGAFPNPNLPLAISRNSKPTSIAVSIPSLKAAGPFVADATFSTSGLINQWAHARIPISNADQLLDIPAGETLLVPGMINIEDTQDTDGPLPILLDEALQPVTVPVGSKPSRRYQRVMVEVTSSKVAPAVTSVMPTQGAPGQNTSFSAITTGPTPTGWAWNFGGGATPNTSTAAQPLVLLGAEGVYSGSVTATNAYGSSVPFPFVLTVSRTPIVTGVNPSGDVGFSGDSVQFAVATTGGVPTAWSWTFGAGASPSSSSVASPQVTLQTPGTYSGSVIASNAYGDSPAFPFEYRVAAAVPPVISAVSPTGVIGSQGTNSSFSATASGNPSSWDWDFGGGTIPGTSTEAEPNVVLGTSGTYGGSVTATNAFGTSAPFPFSYQVTIAPTKPIILAVDPTGTIGLQGSAVTMNATATGSPTQWSWNFDGGASPNTTGQATPQIVLGTAGSYEGVVTATNAVGTSDPFPFAFTVDLPPAPVVANVTPSGIVGAATAQVSFQASATNQPTSWSWNFGGGATPNTSTLASPNVTLGSPGTYQGTVRASNAGGQSPAFAFGYTVSDGDPPPVIFEVSPTGSVGIQGAIVDFSAMANGSPTGWSWNFDGGTIPNTSTAAIPRVLLGAPGTYTGTVTASNAFGSSTPFEFVFTIDPPGAPVVQTVSPTGEVGMEDDVVQFVSASTNSPTGWNWNFGGGAVPNTSTEESPFVTLGDPGTYTGSLRASNAGGTSAPYNFEFTVLVRPPAPSVLSVSPTGYLGVVGADVEFTCVTANSPTNYQWVFGNCVSPSSSTSSSPNVELKTAGTFTGTLTVSNIYGTSAPFQFEFSISAAPQKPTVLSVTPTGIVGSVDENIFFEMDATNSPTSWMWSFGAGCVPEFSAQEKPFVTLATPGTYQGTAQAFNAVGASTPFNFEYIVTAEPVPVIDSHLIATEGSHGSALLFNDRVVIAYEGEGFDMNFAYANVARPEQTSDWTQYPVSTDALRIGSQMCVMNGRLALSYTTATSVSPWIYSHGIARALEIWPADASDWQLSPILTGITATLSVDLTVMDDRFALLSTTSSSHSQSEFRVALAQTAEPTGPGSWVEYSVMDEVVGLESNRGVTRCTSQNRPFFIGQIQTSGSKPYPVEVVYSSLTKPTQASEWASYTLAGSAENDAIQCVALDNLGRMTIAFLDLDVTLGSILKVARATTTAPTLPTDWIISDVVRSDAGNFGALMSVTHNSQNEILLCYYQNSSNAAYIAKSASNAPAGPEDWSIIKIGDGPSFLSFPKANIGCYPDDNFWAVVDLVGSDLTYFTSQTPW